jgi:hypothetical protein
MVSQEEDTMFEPSPCSVYLAGEIAQLYAVLKSDGWKVVFAVFGATRAIVYFCGKSPHHEARNLAAAAVMASIFAVLIAVTESRAPAAVRHALACKAPETQKRLSATGEPPAGPQLAFNSGR